MTDYPEPFNPNPSKLERGDRVVNKHGDLGTIQGPEDFDDYEANDPNKHSSGWYLVKFDEDLYGPKIDRVWIADIWIKKL